MKVICQKCSASYDIENQRIPAEGMTMKCPKCLGSFQVQRPDQPAEAQSSAAAGGETKFFIRRHTGSVFGPFAESAILTMATDGKLDGSEDLSPDKVDWKRIADHAAFGNVFGGDAEADLPAPAPEQPPTAGVPKPDPIPGAAAPPADLPAPVAVQATKMGMPNVKPPSPEVSDLPAPVSAEPATPGRPVAPSKPAITPPAPDMPDMPDLPAPVATGAPAAGGGPPKPAITPPAPDMPDLPAPVASRPPASEQPRHSRPTITPPPPQMPDLPTPLVTGGMGSTPELPTPRAPAGAGISPAQRAPSSPGMPDLPTPVKAKGAAADQIGMPDLPAPKAAAASPASVGVKPGVTPDLPDLPAPKNAGAGGIPDLPAPKNADPGGIPDLPTPKGSPADAEALGQPDLPTPIDMPNMAGGPAQPDLPTPIDMPDMAGEPAQPDLPTPKGAPADLGQEMSYGEVDLPVPTDDATGQGDAPLDLSELDLVAPKAEASDAAAPDLSEMDLVAPKEPASAAPAAQEALGDVADLLEPEDADRPDAPDAPRRKRAERAPSTKGTAPAGGRLLGMPKMVAIAILVVILLGAGGGAAYMFAFRNKKGDTGKKPTTANTNQNAGPVIPRAAVKGRVAYAPAMDLDTHKGYLTADKTYFKQYKKTPSASLKAARAKARLCDAYRYGVKGKRLSKANKLLAAGDADDVERRKAKAVWYLLRKKLKKARGQLKKARAKAKKDPEIYLFRGWVELEAGNAARAQKAFRRAIKYRGESAAALFGLARSLAPREAERQQLLAKVIKLSPRHVGARVAQASDRPALKAAAGIKALTELSSKLGDGAAPLEKANLAAGLGLMHRRLGQLDKALSLLAKASKLAPKNGSILGAEGEALLDADDGEGAAKKLQAALALNVRNDRLLEALVRAHIARGHPLEAKAAILDFTDRQPKAKKGKKKKRKKKATRKKRKKRSKAKRAKRGDKGDKAGGKLPVPPGPNTPYLALARGRVALAQGKDADAKDLFLESTAKAPRFTPGHVAYLELMLKGRKLEGMKSVFELIKRKYTARLPAQLQDMEGQLLLARNKPARAEKAFRSALESEPHNNRILIHLALCLWKHLKRPEDAYLLLQKIYNRAKSMTPVVVLLADYHWTSGEKERAFGRFKSALKANRSLTLRRRFAELLLRAPNPVRLARAEKLLDPILKANSLDHGATALYALVELGKGHPKKALTRINRALARSKKSLPYLVIKARIYETSNKAKDALKIYEDLLARQPKQRRIVLLRARLLCRNRSTKGCITAARVILKTFGDPEGHLLMGQAYLQKRKQGKAVRAFKKAIAKKKDYAEAHFLLGQTLYHDASFRKALTSLIRCLELAEESAHWWSDIHYFLGMAYFKVQNKRLAKKHLSKYLTTPGNPDNVETSEQKRSAKAILKKL